MRDPRPLPEAPDPRREPEGGCGGGGLCLGGASGLPAAGTRTCIRSPRASAEPLYPPRLASPRDAAPALAGELAAGVGARLSLPPGQPQAGRVFGMEGRGEQRAGALEARARPGSSERDTRRRGLSVCLSPLGFSKDLRASGHFRGWDGVWASVGLLRGRRLQPPSPPVLAAVLVSGERPVSLGAEEGEEAESPPRHKGLSAGVELQARAAKLGGERSVGGGQGGGDRGASSSLETPGVCAGGERRAGGGGAALAWGVGRDKDQGNLPLAGHTRVLVNSRGGGNVGNPRNRGGGGKWGAAKYCLRRRRRRFSQRFCAQCFCSPTQLDSSRLPPSHHLAATLALLWFSPSSSPTFHPLLFG